MTSPASDTDSSLPPGLGKEGREEGGMEGGERGGGDWGLVGGGVGL